MAILNSLVVVLSAMNFLAGPVAFVWLVILGEWWALGLAILALMAPTVLAFAMIPGMLLTAPALLLVERRPSLVPIAAIPGLVYTAALITVWCMGVFTLYIMRSTSSSWIPLMLLSYSVGTAPWAFMAQKEAQGGGGEGSMIATFFASLAMLIVIVYVFVARPDNLVVLWKLFAGVMAVEVVVSVFLSKMLLTSPPSGRHAA